MEKNGFTIGTSSDIWVLIEEITGYTLEEANSWLQSNNISFKYILATPTYEILPQELQEQLEDIYNAISMQGQTNITQENNDLPFVLNASAVYDLANLVNVEG